MSKLDKLEHSKVKLTIEVEAELFNGALQKAFLQKGKNFYVQGFRKGKAPRKVIETVYGEGVFYEDAFELLYPGAYEAAVEEHGITPVSQPEVDIEQIGRDKNLVFTTELAVKPEVALGAYKGIEVEKREYNVTDEMIEAQLEREREKLARFVDAERPVEQGDRVKIDYAGSVDGVEFDGGSATEQELEIGSGMFIPGFEEQLVGMEAGEDREIQVKFPQEYHAESLKGKEAVFQVHLHGIQVKELPELDDELAKDVSEFDTLEELRAEKRRELTEQAMKNADIARENEAVEKAVENAQIDIPDAMIERQISYMLNDISYRLSMQGLSFEDYLKYTGTTLDELRDKYAGEAEKRVRTQLVIEAVIKAENIKLEDAELEDTMREFAEQSGKALEDFKAEITQDEREYLLDQALARKAVKLIADSAVEK